MKDITSLLKKTIENKDGPQKAALQKILATLKNTKVNVLLIGGTGVGKSSTINALFHTSDMQMEKKAAIGESANPETMDIYHYPLKNVVIWDTPGLGDSEEKDQQHQQKIVNKLREVDTTGRPLIDLIFLVLDGSSRDFSSAYKLIKDVVAPNLREGDKNRLLIGINKADKVMHHTFWDYNTNQPTSKLIEKLEDQSQTVRNRIADDTGFSPDVIYYAAGEIVEGELVQKPYNIARLLSFLIDHLPEKKRAAVVDDINQNSMNFDYNDEKENYQEKIEKSFTDSLLEIASDIYAHARDIGLEIYEKADVKSILISIGTTAVSAFFAKKVDK